MKWQITSNKRPPHSTPLIISYRGVVQHITYVFDGVTDGEGTETWFMPFYFGGECIPSHEVSHWCELPEPPEVDNNGQH